MTLDEAIKYYEEVVEGYERELKVYENINEVRPLFSEEETECRLCTEEHRQLAEWLKELKEYKAALHGIMDDLLTYARSLSLVGIYNDNVLYCLEIVEKHVDEIESGADAKNICHPCDKCEVGNPCLYCKYDFEQK